MQEPDPPAGPPAPQRLPRPRKKRTVYLKEQLQELRKHFTMNHYPSYGERLSLAARLDLDEHQVQVWLKNRRAKHSRLQGLPKGRGWGAPAVPRGRRDPASVLAPPPSLSPPGPRLGSLLAPPSQGSQASPVWFSTAPRGSLPGGTQSSAPGSMSLPPRPRPSPGSSQASGLPCLGLSPDPMLAPNFTGLLLPQDPLEEPSFPLMSRSQEGDDPADDSDSELRRLLDL